MLEFYFSYRGMLKRLRDGLRWIASRGTFSHSVTSKHPPSFICRIARFGRFAAAHCGSRPIGEAIVDNYLCTFTTDSPRIAAVSALQHARRVAPERFIASTPIVVDDPDAPLLRSFSDYLSRLRGLEPRSRDGVLLGARRFLDWLRHRHPGQDLEALAAEHVFAAVEYRLSLSATSGTRTAAISHIRTFLLFLHWGGHHEQDLAPVVPRTPYWRLAHLPSRLSWDDVRRAIDAIGKATPIDLRDRAVLLLLATTGIRNGKLRALQIRDIDWRAGEVFVRRTGANVTEWPRSSRRLAPRSPTTSCELDRRSIVSICSCPSRRPWDHSSTRRLFRGSCGSDCSMVGSNSVASEAHISCATV
ncbi:Tyrosine recombinase XerC [Bradyrhizobium ivorense]|nr:Tyrosine recombinase XerC [Bradyrhizobium ivorense]